MPEDFFVEAGVVDPVFFPVAVEDEEGAVLAPSLACPFVTTVFFLTTLRHSKEDCSMCDNASSLIREAIRHAEAKQSAQLQIALASDARAMTLCVACAGIAGVLVTAAVAVGVHSGSVAILMMAITFFLAAAVSAWSARPISFAAPGQNFSDFSEDIAEDRDLNDVLSELGGHLDACAAENEMRVSNNALYFRAGLALAAAAPLIGLLVMLVEQ